MADPHHTPRSLSARQVETVDALLDAGLEVLGEVGYDKLTVRNVAERAGVTHTTAYAYFSSKDHLVAEALRRVLDGVDDPAAPDPDLPAADRVRLALDAPARAAGQHPALAHAALTALMSPDSDVAAVRDAVGARFIGRIRTAVGDDVDADGVDTLVLAFSGAMLQAGMGYFTFAEVVDHMATAVRALTDDRP